MEDGQIYINGRKRLDLRADEIYFVGNYNNGLLGTLRVVSFNNINLTGTNSLQLPLNTLIDGQKLYKVSYYETTDITFDDNSYYNCTTVLPGCHIQITQGLKNTMCTFTTDSTFTYSVEIDSSYKINKPFEFERKFKLYNCC